MPANLFTETLPVNTNVEEQRALHLAFELSMLGLDEDTNTSNMNDSDASAELMKKNNGANMTECVPVPSSEHVAEIVGRQGKILVFIHSYIWMLHVHYIRSNTQSKYGTW